MGPANLEPSARSNRRALSDPNQSLAVKSVLERVVARQQQQIVDEISSQRQIRYASLNMTLQQQVATWGAQLHSVVWHQDLSAHARREMTLLERCRQMAPEELIEEIPSFRLQLKGHSPMDQVLLGLVDKLPSMSHSVLVQTHSSLLQEWEQSIEQRFLAQQLALLDQQRAELLAELYRRFDSTNDLAELFPSAATHQIGRLWDMADVTLSRQQMKNLTQLADFLEKQPEIQALAAQIGRLAKVVNGGQLKRVREKAVAKEPQFISLPEEVTGVEEGKDLARLLATSASLLSMEELEFLFYKQLTESRLSIYEMKGKAPQKGKVKPVIRQKPSETEDNGGPFILCVDTSASMAGQPERCAKGLALALMREAVNAERDCQVMIFSTQTQTFDLMGGQGLSQARDFLNYHFHGGTDIGRCIFAACETLNRVPFANADVVVVSDFIAPRIRDNALKQLELAKLRGNRFHAISLSREANHGLLAQMTHQWPMETSIWGRVQINASLN